MRVIHVCELATIRVLKQVIAQQSQWETYLWYRETFHADAMGWAFMQSTWDSPEQLQVKLPAVEGVSAIHVHTSIHNADLLRVVAAKTNAPIVWDMHDWVDPTPYLDLVSHIIVPSAGYKDKLEKLGVSYVSVVYSMVPRMLFPEIDKRKTDAGVLVSGLDRKGGVIWRDYTEIQKKLKRPLYIYSDVLSPELCGTYDNLMLTCPYIALLRQLTKYSFGYAGAANSRHTIHDCVTNKFWEYVAAGLPILTYRSDEMTALAGLDWFGQELSRPNDKIHPQPSQALAEARYRYTMESQLTTLVKAYKLTIATL